jgi:hypothetical protein
MEIIMSGIDKNKLTDAHRSERPHRGLGHGPDHLSLPDGKTAVKQTREAKESEQARCAEASNRDRMVEIGRGNLQAGRQGQ